MVYTYDWDETKPAGTRALNLGDDDIREFKSAIRERLQGGGMYFPSTDDDDAGLFNYVKFKEQSGNPSAEANRGFLFTKDVSGVTELYWMDSAGNVNALTSGGKLLITSLIIASEAQGDVLYRGASAWARLAAGTSGQFLKTQGAGADPAWDTVASAASAAEVLAGTEAAKYVAPSTLVSHEGVIKGRISFNGTGTPAIYDSFNVDTGAGITDNGTGDYTIPWNTDFADTNYTPIGMAREGSALNTSMCVSLSDEAGAIAVGSVRIQCRAQAVTATDPDYVFLIAIGDR